MIEARGLTKYFDDFLAVNQVSFQVQMGQVMVLLGPNGAGKTTTIRMLTSILRPSAGTAFIGGHSVTEEPDTVRGLVGVLTEHHGLYNRMNAMEYLHFFGELYRLPANEIKPRCQELLRQFELSNVSQQRLGEYSKGMRQKLALARALIHRPPVLLLDEPTSAMDPASARMVRDAIHQLRSNDHAVLLCTHNLTEAEELADQIAIIEHGRILFYDTPAALKRRLSAITEYKVAFSAVAPGWQMPEIAGVKQVNSQAKYFYIHIDESILPAAELLRQLINTGLPVDQFVRVERSLEEGYLAVVAENNKEKPGAQR